LQTKHYFRGDMLNVTEDDMNINCFVS